MDRMIERKKGLQKNHLPYVAGGLFVLLVLLWMVFGNHQRTLQVEAADLTLSQATQGEFKDSVRLNGTVVPIQVVHISPE